MQDTKEFKGNGSTDLDINKKQQFTTGKHVTDGSMASR